MRRIILQDRRHIYPFNESARDLRLQNKPLWLHQRDLLAPYCSEERDYAAWDEAELSESGVRVEALMHRDNLFFNQALLEEFLGRAREQVLPARLALRLDDPTVAAHILPITKSVDRRQSLLLFDIWYLPDGFGQHAAAQPLIVDSGARERGYYHVPRFMAGEFGDLTYQLPQKSVLAIESWAHLFVADILFGVFSRGTVTEDRINVDWKYKIRLLLRSLVEQRSALSSSYLVRCGRNCHVDPTARIYGPSTIGNNVTIGAGVVIDNCIIGDNVTISQGCQLMLSVVGDGCFLPFRAALFMSTMMENSMVAQNTCVQLCVIGRDTFIGAGTTFTDFNLLPTPLKAILQDGLNATNFTVLGACVGHHCRLGSGLVIFPGRTIESDVVLVASEGRRVFTKDVRFEDSDHLQYQAGHAHTRHYPRLEESDPSTGRIRI